MTVSVKAPTSTTGSIQLNGSDVLTIDSSGNLTAPNNLTVTGTVTQTGGATFNGGISGNVAFDTDTLYVDATNNRVGIGTSSPSYPLHVVTSDAVAGKIQANRSGGFAYFDIQNTSTTVAGSAAITRLITQNAAGTGTTSTDIYRIATGQFSINNNETNSAAFTSFGVGGTERMRIDSSGNVLIGVTASGAITNGVTVVSPATTTVLNIGHIVGSASNTDFVVFRYNGTNIGSITQSGTTTTAYNTSSDYRLKENVAPMSGSIDRLKQLKPSTWAWVQDGSHGEGFLAHEAAEVVPEAVTGEKDAMQTEEYEVTPAVLDNDGNVVTEAVMGTREVPDYQGIDQAKLVPLLTAALQEAITKIENLETRIQALENQ